MATKTITLEIDAYEKLRRAKKNSKESFSSVVRRAVFPKDAMTGEELMREMEMRISEGRALVDEETLDRLDTAQQSPRRSTSEW
jgi:predicted CopG family antitoxin